MSLHSTLKIQSTKSINKVCIIIIIKNFLASVSEATEGSMILFQKNHRERCYREGTAGYSSRKAPRHYKWRTKQNDCVHTLKHFQQQLVRPWETATLSKKKCWETKVIRLRKDIATEAVIHQTALLLLYAISGATSCSYVCTATCVCITV